MVARVRESGTESPRRLVRYQLGRHSTVVNMSSKAVAQRKGGYIQAKSRFGKICVGKKIAGGKSKINHVFTVTKCPP